jgi:lipopolysaccharide export system protein LptC
MQLLREAWDRFLLYVPLTVMGFLALGSYWLVRTSPAADVPVVAGPVTHDADYFMNGFVVKTFDVNGRIRTEVVGEKARHYPDTKLLEIDAIRVRSIDEKGHLTTASAVLGITNEDNSEIQLLGNAVVIREGELSTVPNPAPRMEYRGEFLHAFLTTERVTSHKPVELTRGSDHFTADRMDYDNVEQTLQLQGRVRGTLVPAVKP